jgi:hypothetical protein
MLDLAMRPRRHNVPPRRAETERGSRGCPVVTPLSAPEIDRRGLALPTALEVEAHSLAFLQVAKAGAFDRRDVHEHIF